MNKSEYRAWETGIATVSLLSAPVLPRPSAAVSSRWLGIELDREPDVAAGVASAGGGWVDVWLDVAQVGLKMGLGWLGLCSALVLEAATLFFKIWVCTLIKQNQKSSSSCGGGD